MTLSDGITLAVLGLCVVVFFYARRKGRADRAAALAAAHASGRAEVTAELHAMASVAVHVDNRGVGASLDGRRYAAGIDGSGSEYDYDGTHPAYYNGRPNNDNHPAGVGVGLPDVRTLRAGRADGDGVGELLDGVQHGSATVVPRNRVVDTRSTRISRLPRIADPVTERVDL